MPCFRIKRKILGMLFSVIYIFMVTGCSSSHQSPSQQSPSYQGVRVQISPELLQEIENMSIDEAVEIITLYFQKDIEKYASDITQEEWEKMKDEMNSKPWRQRQLTTANLGLSRRKWYGWTADKTSIVYRTYLEDTERWVKIDNTSSKRERVPPQTNTIEYRYADVIELRNIKNSNGKSGLKLYCDTKNGSGSSFWLYPDDENVLESLRKAFVKLCPNIRK